MFSWKQYQTGGDNEIESKNFQKSIFQKILVTISLQVFYNKHETKNLNLSAETRFQTASHFESFGHKWRHLGFFWRIISWIGAATSRATCASWSQPTRFWQSGFFDFIQARTNRNKSSIFLLQKKWVKYSIHFFFQKKKDSLELGHFTWARFTPRGGFATESTYASLVCLLLVLMEWYEFWTLPIRRSNFSFSSSIILQKNFSNIGFFFFFFFSI